MPDAVVTQQVNARDVPYFDLVLMGLVGMGIMTHSIISIAVRISNYRNLSILKRILVTPLAIWKFFAAEVTAQLLLAVIQAVVILAVGVLVFDARIVGNALHLLPVIILGSLVFLNIGFILSAWANSPAAASGMGNVIAFPMMFFAGTFFSTSALPWLLPYAADALPLAPMITALRDIGLHGATLWEVWPQLAWLVGWVAATSLGRRPRLPVQLTIPAAQTPSTALILSQSKDNPRPGTPTGTPLQRVLERRFQHSFRGELLELGLYQTVPSYDKGPRLGGQAPFSHRRRLFGGKAVALNQVGVCKDFDVDEVGRAAVTLLQSAEDVQLGAAGGADAEGRGGEENYQGLGLVQGLMHRQLVKLRVGVVGAGDVGQVGHVPGHRGLRCGAPGCQSPAVAGVAATRTAVSMVSTVAPSAAVALMASSHRPGLALVASPAWSKSMWVTKTPRLLPSGGQGRKAAVAVPRASAVVCPGGV